MLILTPQTTHSKNLLYSDDIEAMMLKVELSDGSTFRFTGDSADITWKGELYQSFPFEFEEISENTKGELPRYNIRVSNVNRLVESYIQQVDGGVGSPVTLSAVNKTAIADDPNTRADVEIKMTVRAVSTNESWVSFTLGAPNPYSARIPQDRILKNHCRHHFRGKLCRYSGLGAVCNKTLAQCREYRNTENYGGFPGAGSSALYK